MSKVIQLRLDPNSSTVINFQRVLWDHQKRAELAQLPFGGGSMDTGVDEDQDAGLGGLDGAPSRGPLPPPPPSPPVAENDFFSRLLHNAKFYNAPKARRGANTAAASSSSSDNDGIDYYDTDDSFIDDEEDIFEELGVVTQIKTDGYFVWQGTVETKLREFTGTGKDAILRRESHLEDVAASKLRRVKGFGLDATAKRKQSIAEALSLGGVHPTFKRAKHEFANVFPKDDSGSYSSEGGPVPLATMAGTDVDMQPPVKATKASRSSTVPALSPARPARQYPAIPSNTPDDVREIVNELKTFLDKLNLERGAKLPGATKPKIDSAISAALAHCYFLVKHGGSLEDFAHASESWSAMHQLLTDELYRVLPYGKPAIRSLIIKMAYPERIRLHENMIETLVKQISGMVDEESAGQLLRYEERTKSYTEAKTMLETTISTGGGGGGESDKKGLVQPRKRFSWPPHIKEKIQVVLKAIENVVPIKNALHTAKLDMIRYDTLNEQKLLLDRLANFWPDGWMSAALLKRMFMTTESSGVDAEVGAPPPPAVTKPKTPVVPLRPATFQASGIASSTTTVVNGRPSVGVPLPQAFSAQHPPFIAPITQHIDTQQQPIHPSSGRQPLPPQEEVRPKAGMQHKTRPASTVHRPGFRQPVAPLPTVIPQVASSNPPPLSVKNGNGHNGLFAKQP